MSEELETYKIGIIVEGIKDANRVLEALPPEEFPHVIVAWNQGTRDGSKMRSLVVSLKECVENAIWALTDPDEAGDIVAEKLSHYGIPRIVVDVEKCTQTRLAGPFLLKKRGVEYADPAYLRQVICETTGLEAVPCSARS